MRTLSPSFFAALKTGFLQSLAEQVRKDSDLNLEIREQYINIYFKGNSLLKLREISEKRYEVSIHQKFVDGLVAMPHELIDETSVERFLALVPLLKENIIKTGKRSMELEYEQMLIRANNFEARNNSEYFIVDRQFTMKGVGRGDLLGIYWDTKARQTRRTAAPCLIEVKFALNNDISDVHNQLQRYYNAIELNAAKLAEEIQGIFRQKIELGLYKFPENRLSAMKSLTISNDISDFRFLVIFIDFNPNSALLAKNELTSLPFAHQIRIFRTGFAMWDDNVKPIHGSLAAKN